MTYESPQLSTAVAGLAKQLWRTYLCSSAESAGQSSRLERGSAERNA